MTYIDEYMRSPFGPTVWFCSRVLTRSSGKTHDTPIIPAIPPLTIFGTSLKKIKFISNYDFGILYNNKNKYYRNSYSNAFVYLILIHCSKKHLKIRTDGHHEIYNSF